METPGSWRSQDYEAAAQESSRQQVEPTQERGHVTENGKAIGPGLCMPVSGPITKNRMPRF